MYGAERLKGNLDVLLLAAVNAGRSHGYAIIQRLRERSASVLDLPEGTLYPALHRLETAGFVCSAWDTVNGRRRRVYSITKQGEQALKTERQEWGTFARAVDAVIEA